MFSPWLVQPSALVEVMAPTSQAGSPTSIASLPTEAFSSLPCRKPGNNVLTSPSCHTSCPSLLGVMIASSSGVLCGSLALSLSSPGGKTRQVTVGKKDICIAHYAPRIILATIASKGMSFQVMSIHAPTRDTPPQQVDAFWDEVQGVPHKHTLKD
eukprot:11871967-Alexandrium_andersonii.AAC.1